MSPHPTYASVVLDANIGVYFAWNTKYTQQSHTLVQRLIQDGVLIAVPEIWKAEVVSSLRRWGMHYRASSEDVRKAVHLALNLPSLSIDLDADLCYAALSWAERMNDQVVYDAFYLATAERLNALLWTADRPFYRKAVGAGASFVRLFPDDLP